MTREEVLETLEGELNSFPERASPADFHRHLVAVLGRLCSENRPQVVGALSTWLQSRSDPRTLTAVNLIGKLGLTELRTDLEALLTDIRSGAAFLPYYAQWVEIALDKLGRP
jgi:hypothetical protein